MSHILKKNLRTFVTFFVLAIAFVSILIAGSTLTWLHHSTTEDLVVEQFQNQLKGETDLFHTDFTNLGELKLTPEGELMTGANPLLKVSSGIKGNAQALGSKITVFAKTGQGWKRVFTNLEDQNGEAVPAGSLLDPNSKAAAALNQKQLYASKVDLYGKEYVARYTPFENTAGEVIGAYFLAKPTEQLQAALAQSQRNFLMTGLLAMLAALLIAAICSSFFSKELTAPLTAVTGLLERQAGLDFSQDPPPVLRRYQDSTTEVGKMVRAFIQMKSTISGFVQDAVDTSSKVRESADQFKQNAQQASTVSEEVAKAIEEIAQGASDQAKDTAESLDQVASMDRLMQQDNQLLQNLNQVAAQIHTRRQEGSTIIEELIEKTRLSNEAVLKIQQGIVSTNDSAEKIENASTMIQSISDQTNLLALNAAIEAARAGEAGRGFSVVAQEIRKLAEQSNRFTGDIKAVIDELKHNTEQSVDIMEQVKSLGEQQTHSVFSTQEKFSGISDSIEEATGVISQLNGSNKEMEQDKNRIVDLSQRLSAIAQENAASTQQAAASVEEQSATIQDMAGASDGLNDLARRLLNKLEEFKL